MQILSKEEFQRALLNLQTNHENDITLDKDDVTIPIKCKDSVSMFTSEHIGKNASNKAMSLILEQIKENPLTITKNTNTLVHFQLHPNFSTIKLSETIDLINQVIDEEADSTFFTSTIQSTKDKQVCVTVFIYENEYKPNIPINNIKG